MSIFYQKAQTQGCNANGTQVWNTLHDQNFNLECFCLAGALESLDATLHARVHVIRDSVVLSQVISYVRRYLPDLPVPLHIVYSYSITVQNPHRSIQGIVLTVFNPECSLCGKESGQHYIRILLQSFSSPHICCNEAPFLCVPTAVSTRISPRHMLHIPQ